jgi:predicted  nucleic acid-binding Zn-ribbon protein
MANLEERLWDSDQSTALTHEAARRIERLNWTIDCLRSRAQSAEADCEKLRQVIEILTDELSSRGEKIVELDLEVRRLQKTDIYADARINDTPITQFASSQKRDDP